MDRNPLEELRIAMNAMLATQHAHHSVLLSIISEVARQKSDWRGNLDYLRGNAEGAAKMLQLPPGDYNDAIRESSLQKVSQIYAEAFEALRTAEDAIKG